MIDTFEKIIQETDQTVIEQFWQQVKDNEEILHKELRRKIEE